MLRRLSGLDVVWKKRASASWKVWKPHRSVCGCKLHRVLLRVVQHDQICRRLMTMPGVGATTS
jgi:hypothetical protein